MTLSRPLAIVASMEAPGAGTLLLVEDDPALALGLCDTLEFEGFRVVHAKTGAQAVGLARAENPVCIILDLMLPDLNGYQVCEQIRERDQRVPILMLTARSQEVDKIRGLEVGADDYVTKPFSVGELVARVRALLRRAARQGAHAAPEPFEIGECVIDPVRKILRRGKKSSALSFYEIELLRVLHERAGQPVPRDEILERVWGQQESPRTVDNFIVKLRKKIEPTPERPQHILTVYGIGYRLVV